MKQTTWRAILFFFAWGFVMHGVGLLLHELGGHGVAMTILGCGMSRVDLTYFGVGVAYSAPCPLWTWTTTLIRDWAGLALTIGVGAGAMAFQRRAGLTPMTRLLLALLGTGFLLSQLSYATSGGFHDLYDPGLTARLLAARGLHVVAWLPPLVLFAVSALFGARAIVDAFRALFGSRTRLETLEQIAATLGAAGLLYYVAFRVEWSIRTDIPVRGISFEAEQIATFRHQAPPFPIHLVLLAIEVAAFVAALARQVSRETAGQEAAPGAIPQRHAAIVGAAALVCFGAITLLVRV